MHFYFFFLISCSTGKKLLKIDDGKTLIQIAVTWVSRDAEVLIISSFKRRAHNQTTKTKRRLTKTYLRTTET